MSIFGIIIASIFGAILLIALSPLLLVALGMSVVLFAITGWFFAILAFIYSGATLGLLVLILWIIVLGAS